MTAQSVILPLPSHHARFIVLNLKDLSIETLKLSNPAPDSLTGETVTVMSSFSKEALLESFDKVPFCGTI